MALRTQIAIGALLILGAAGAEELRLPVERERAGKNHPGMLVVQEQGLRFEGPGDDQWSGSLADIQQALLEWRRLRVVTYEDNRWKLGADRELRFRLAPDDAPRIAAALAPALGRRFVNAYAESLAPASRIPAKHLERWSGTIGELEFAPDRIVFRSGQPAKSRTWRLEDIENVSRGGPFDLTVTTFERSRAHYGGRRDFTFQLRAPLEEPEFNRLWQQVVGRLLPNPLSNPSKEANR